MNIKKIKLIIPMLFAIFTLVFTPTCVKASSNNLYINNEIKNVYMLDVNCNDAALGDVNDENSVAWLLQKILDYMKILGPTIAVVLGSIDFAKAIITSDEENMKKTETRFIKRLVAAALLFLIPTFVSILLNIVGLTCTAGGLS